MGGAAENHKLVNGDNNRQGRINTELEEGQQRIDEQIKRVISYLLIYQSKN